MCEELEKFVDKGPMSETLTQPNTTMGADSGSIKSTQRQNVLSSQTFEESDNDPQTMIITV